jgi:DNA-binding response OmpR family regulator
MRIAVVDDDDDVIEFVRGALARAGHGCADFGSCAAALAALRRETFDLMLLDWNLPDGAGIDLLQSIRAVSSAMPVIMITSRADKDDIAAALHAGADDYVIKPESAQVIVARVEAVLRRAAPAAAPQRVARFGDYGFDHLTESVTIGDAPVPLSAKEFRLALIFFENLHRAMSRGYLLESVWHSVSDLPTRTLDMHVSRIRSKLRLMPENGFRIVSISGYGYRMERFGAGGTGG